MRRILTILFVALVLLMAALLLVLQPRHVSGIIQDELGPPIPHAIVLLGDRALYPNEAGDYNLGWVIGTVTLTIQADGYLPLRTLVPRGQLPGQSTWLPIILARNTLSGTVQDLETGAPLQGSIVTVGEASFTTDAYGHYTVQGIRSGALLTVSMPGYQMEKAVFSGQQTQDFALQPIRTQIVVLDLYSHQPVAGASVTYDSAEITTDDNGSAVVKRLLPGSSLLIRAVGYETLQHVYHSEESIAVGLRPDTLQGVIRDKRDGRPLAGVAVQVVSAEQVVTSTVTGQDGRYFLQGVPPTSTLMLAAPEYERFEQPIGPVVEMDVDLQLFEVRGIYLPLGLLTSPTRVNQLVQLVNETELNAIVVDMKNDRGWLAFASDLVEAKRSKAYQAEVMDVHRFLALCKENGIYTIARIVLFKDPTMAAAYPEWAVHAAEGQLYVDTEGSAWLDPFRAEVQDYLIALAKEVAELGFDELQFDYIRFPSDGPVGKAKYSQESTLESRCTTIREFCARLRQELQPYGVILSADLFGLTVWVNPENDMGIGQRVIDIAPYMDYLSPMVYPATFVAGNLGYEDPMQYPYEIVYRSCIELSKRTNTRVRPWLQHYSWKGAIYGTEELHLEKKAAEDAGTYGWMFWHAAGRYSADVFEPARGSP